LALVALVALWMSAGGLVIPFFNIYFQRLHGLAIDRIGLIFALVQAVTALVVFGSGLASSWLGPRRVLVIWMLIFAPALWGLVAVSAAELAILLFLIQGLVPPATNPLIDQILLESAVPEQHGAISSWRNGATELSGLIGAGAGGLLLEFGSFPLLFGVAGVVALLGALTLGSAVNREGRRRPPQSPTPSSMRTAV
jgi:predicted MFS family arabinose efflux permease